MLTSQPFLIQRDQMPEMSRLLRRLTLDEDFDAIHADQLWMAAFALQAEVAAKSGGKSPLLVLDQHNAVYLIPQRMAADSTNPLKRFILQREARVMADYELKICKQFDQVLWVTQEDLNAVSRLTPKDEKITNQKRNTVLPICIDTSENHQRREQYTTKPSTILFLGGMHWPPNAEGIEWFVKEVFPIIRTKVPDSRLAALGNSPPESILSVPGVQAPGYVEDVEPFWQNAQVFIVPLHAGGGMRVKIVDAWSHSVPIVSTTIGAEGLAYQDGENILIADTPGSFVEAIQLLAHDPYLWQKLSQNGRETVEQHYQWDKVYAPLDKIYP